MGMFTRDSSHTCASIIQDSKSPVLQEVFYDPDQTVELEQVLKGTTHDHSIRKDAQVSNRQIQVACLQPG